MSGESMEHKNPERKDKKPKLSANMVTLISCRNRQIVKLADAAREKGSEDGDYQLSGLK
jgi:hypothetical protein